MAGLVSTERRPVHRAEVSEPGFRHQEGPAGDLTARFEVASDDRVLDAAFRLVHDQYVKLGYMAPHPSGRRLGVHNALPTTRVFVAQRGRAVVGTITLILDSAVRLPMDEVYAEELDRLRARGRAIAEVSALAVDDEAAGGGPIVPGLIRMALLYAIEVARLDELCIAVNPRHASFYRKLLHFRDLAGVRTYARVNGAPAVALATDLATIESSMERAREEGVRQRALYASIFGAANRHAALEHLWQTARGAALSFEAFWRFFGDGSVLEGCELADALRAFYTQDRPLPRSEPRPWPRPLPLDRRWILPSVRCLAGR